MISIEDLSTRMRMHKLQCIVNFEPYYYTCHTCQTAAAQAMYLQLWRHSCFILATILPDYRYRYDKEQSTSPLASLETWWPAKPAHLEHKALTPPILDNNNAAP